MEPGIDPLLAKVRRAVQDDLESFFSDKKSWADRVSSYYLDLVEALEEFTLRGGKRVRAALVVIGYSCVSSEEPGRQVYRAAMAMELLQAFLLAHDDIVDRDESSAFFG